MPREVRCSIIQASNAVPATESLALQKKTMIDKHLGLIRKAASDGAQIVCLQEIFNGPYFCAEQSTKWYEATESVPDGPTVKLMQDVAKELHIAMVVPVYEVEQEGIFTTRQRFCTTTAATSASTARRTFRTSLPDFGRSFTFVPAISATRFSISALPR